MTVSATYLLRVRLPDRPGLLGSLATALGSTGADIDSIVVVDQISGYAVDDLVLSVPVEALVDRLVTAATSVPGVIVETIQRHHGRRRLHDDLALLDDAVSSADPLVVLAEGLPDLMHASYALAIVSPDQGARMSRLLAASMAAPDTECRVQWLPLASARELTAAEVWDDPSVAGPDCELAAVPFRGSSAFLLGRIGGPAFRPAELTRLAHLARVAEALLASADAT
jgi:ACT domain-containing protein